MANVNLKEKTEDGYRLLYPSTLGRNVITSTGNVQTDILNLMAETGKIPENYYTKDETDSMFSETSETIFEGYAELFNGDFVDCTIPGILEDRDRGMLAITVGNIQFDWFVLTIPISALMEDFGFFVPSEVHQGYTLLFLKAQKQGNSLYFTSINYTGISQISIKK